MLESLFNKENPTQVFSCEIRDIFKSVFFDETPPVAVSDSFRFPACNVIKECFSVNIEKFLRTPFR